MTGNCSFLAITTGNYRPFIFFLWDYSNAIVDCGNATVDLIDYRQTTIDYSSTAQHIYLLYRHYRRYSSLLQSATVFSR